MAGVPALTTLIDQRSAGVSRLTGEVLLPAPSVVLINLGENGVPADRDVTHQPVLAEPLGVACRGGAHYQPRSLP